MAIMMKVRRYQLEHKRGFRQVAISILGGPISVNLGLQIRCFSIIETSTVFFEPFSKSRPSFRLFDYRWTDVLIISSTRTATIFHTLDNKNKTTDWWKCSLSVFWQSYRNYIQQNVIPLFQKTLFISSSFPRFPGYYRFYQK